MPNTNLILQIADHIERHPQQHAQDVWVATGTDVPGGCGTAACIAGWAVLLAKPEWLAPKPEGANDDWYEISLDEASILHDEPNLYAGWEQVGAHLLDLDARQADVLFQGHAMPRDENTSWPDALRQIARGTDVLDVIDG